MKGGEKMRNPDIELALKIYYTMPEIGTPEIKKLFDVKDTKAVNLKKQVKIEMAKQGIRCFIPNHINTKLAFDIWGINIPEYENNLKHLQRLKLKEGC